MNKTLRSTVARLTLISLLIVLAPVPAWSDPGGARIEGLLVDLDGRAATGYTVHLIDERGEGVARGTASESGIYSIGDLPRGEYSLAIESPDGLMAPVASPAVSLGNGQLARRDVKLMEGAPGQRDAAVAGNYSMGMWWAGLSTQARVWTIVGSVVILGVTIAALTSEDKASPFD